MGSSWIQDSIQFNLKLMVFILADEIVHHGGKLKRAGHTGPPKRKNSGIPTSSQIFATHRSAAGRDIPNLPGFETGRAKLLLPSLRIPIQSACTNRLFPARHPDRENRLIFLYRAEVHSTSSFRFGEGR